MTNLGNKKLLLIIGIAVLLIGIPVAIFLVSRPVGFRLGAQVPKAPENVAASGVTTTGATITWTTATAVQGGINYGLSTSSLIFFKPEISATTNHVVNLEGLVPASQYFFTIKIGEQSFDNSGQPWTFTTKTAIPTPPALTEEGLMAVMGTSNATYDLNKDGIVNLMDLELLRQQAK